MNEVTRILNAAHEGDEHAAEQLLPLVYAELRRLAAHKMAREKMARERSDHTLEATALVHEAYLRLVDREESNLQHWDGRAHFFSAAAEAMRRILIESARRKHPELAKIVSLRYFADMTVPETATALGVSPSTIDRQWACARAWLYREITEEM